MGKLNKMQECRKVFRRIALDENIEPKDRRKEFKSQVLSDEDLQMTPNGANSYFQMCKRDFEGHDMYESHRKHNAKVKKNKSSNTQETETPAVETTPAKDVDLDSGKRWRVVDRDSRKLIDAFTTRSRAAKFNREQKDAGNDTVMVDGLKEDRKSA